MVGDNFSENWKIFSIVKYWNSKILKSWEDIKKELDISKTVSGYLYDVDHGTIRFWGGKMGGKLPKVEIYKI